MVIKSVIHMLLVLLLFGCISGPPRDLQDDEVMWIEFDDTTPEEARQLITNTLKSNRYACTQKTIGRKGMFYSCGQGSDDNHRQVKGYCNASPASLANSVCDVFVLAIIDKGLFSFSYSQPEHLRQEIEVSILSGTNARLIDRPFKRNNYFSNYVNTPRYEE